MKTVPCLRHRRNTLVLLAVTGLAWWAQAFVLPTTTITKTTPRWERELRSQPYDPQSCPVVCRCTSPRTEEDPSAASSSSSSPPRDVAVLTSVLFQISYDGSRFSGWSAGNHEYRPHGNDTAAAPPVITHSTRSRTRRRRNRHSQEGGGGVRSVQGVLQEALARVYGNVDRRRVVVEGASRTDRGVHATGAVARVYGLKNDDTTRRGHDHMTTATNTVVAGKRLPHPRNGADDDSAAFMPLPQSPARLAFTLNRMLPPDVRIRRYAVVPCDRRRSPFHASRSATAKTYAYRLALGGKGGGGRRPDPLSHRTVWYVGDDDGDAWNEEALRRLFALWTARAYDFSAWQGAPRGPDDRRRRTTRDPVCRLHRVHLRRLDDDDDSHSTSVSDHLASTYELIVTGDRFLYKMMRFLAGTVVAVARERVTVDRVRRDLLEGAKKKKDPHDRAVTCCAPARGLILRTVHYDDDEDDLVWQDAHE